MKLYRPKGVQGLYTLDEQDGRFYPSRLDMAAFNETGNGLNHMRGAQTGGIVSFDNAAEAWSWLHKWARKQRAWSR